MNYLMDEQDPMGGILMSPGMAMAAQAATNLTNMRMNQPVRRNPIQAYQQNVLARQQQAMNASRARPASFQEYQIARQQGYPGTYVDFLQMGQSDSRPMSVKEWEYLQNLPEGDKERFLSNKRRNEIVKIGDVPGTVNPITEQWEPLTEMTQEEVASLITRQAATRAGAERGAQEGATFEWEQVSDALDKIDANREAYAVAKQVNELSQYWKDQISTGQVDTGPIDAFLLNMLGIGRAEMAELGADQIEQALQNLQIVNLAPVTEKEFGEILKLWADIARQEAPNVGRLNSAIRRTERLMKSIETKSRLQERRIREYNPAEADRLLQYDEWMRGLVPIEVGDDLGDIPG